MAWVKAVLGFDGTVVQFWELKVCVVLIKRVLTMDASPLSGPPGPPPQAFVIPATGEMADMSMDEDMDSPNARPGPTTTLGPPSQSRVSRNPLPTTRYVTPYKICVLVLLEMWCRMGEDLGTAASDALLEFVNSRVVNSASSFGEPGFAELRRQVETLADEHGEIVARHFIETVGLGTVNEKKRTSNFLR